MSATQPIGAPLGRENIQPCCICGKGVMHTGLPLCWRVTIERLAFDPVALRGADALDRLIGPALSSVMGPTNCFATPLGDADQMLVCENCAVTSGRCIASLVPEE